MISYVVARALDETTVVRMPISAFAELLENSPESLVRVVQLVMTRLQRVTFSALRDYLGLSHELMKSDKHTSLVPHTPAHPHGPNNHPRKYSLCTGTRTVQYSLFYWFEIFNRVSCRE